jgi:CheY-like chemotaxis protein
MISLVSLETEVALVAAASMNALQPRDREKLVAQRASTPETSVILIVEDDFWTRRIAALYLREIGYRVIEAATAGEGVSVFSSGTHVDLVFSDINMPGDLNGDAFAQWLATCYPSVPMLLTSGMSHAAVAVPGNLRRFIAKPYHLHEVDWQIRTML